jgi:hypothetical protein
MSLSYLLSLLLWLKKDRSQDIQKNILQKVKRKHRMFLVEFPSEEVNSPSSGTVRKRPKQDRRLNTTKPGTRMEMKDSENDGVKLGWIV